MIRRNRSYSWRKFTGDCAGGMIAALIALPYGLSMAALMGLPPVMGVLTSILTAPITALLGRNQVLIGGTASATVPFIAHAVHTQGIGGAAKVSIVAAVFMMVFSVLRLGRFVGTVPHAVLAGFSAGTGAIMITSQWNGSLGSGRWEPALLAAVVVVMATLAARYTPRFPAPLVGITIATLLALGLRLHEPLVGSLSLAVPPLAGFSWKIGRAHV